MNGSFLTCLSRAYKIKYCLNYSGIMSGHSEKGGWRGIRSLIVLINLHKEIAIDDPSKGHKSISIILNTSRLRYHGDKDTWL